MSQIVQRALRPTSTRPHRVVTQRRFKTFERKVDKNNEVYYTIAKRRLVQDPEAAPRSQQFFEMPNLLLDLDAEGIHNVRVFEEKDEELLQSKWRINHKREEVKLKLNDIEGKLIESRRKARDIIANPSSIWRLTSHDILSAALHGPPTKESSAVVESSCLDSMEGSHLIEALRLENGIPSHATTSDVLLLEWMLLRRHNTDSTKTTNNEGPISSSALVEAVKSQSSIVGIRRTLLHALRSRASLKEHFGPFSDRNSVATDVAGQIRSSCIAILKPENTQAGQFLSCLALLGSLLEKLSKAGIEPDHRLHGLAIRVASQSSSLVSLSEWIHRIHATGSWEESHEIAEDAAACLEGCSKQLSSRSESVANRQLLLQLLTGLNEHEKLSPESLRYMALTYFEKQANIPAVLSSGLSEGYAALLGELGAVRTLLKESESSTAIIKNACTSVLKNTPKYSQTLKTQGVKSLSIEQCVVLDYHDIEEQTE